MGVDPPTDLDAQRSLIARVADHVVADGMPTLEYLTLLDVELAPVDRSHVAEGMVDMWTLRNGRPPIDGELRQLRPGHGWYAAPMHPPAQRLDMPLSRFTAKPAWRVSNR